MKVGITLPTFESSVAPAMTTAWAAEAAGLDGVFVFDHLWPIGQPSRPALSAFPVLAAVVAKTRRIRIGPLVARLGLLPDRLVVDSLVSLFELAGPRLVAALGIGDGKSAGENDAYGIVSPALVDRRASLSAVLDRLSSQGIECWVGATATDTLEIARSAGVVVNLWDVELERLEHESARGPATWAGPLPADAASAARRLVELRDAGASWAIWGWPRSIELVAEAVRLARVQDANG